MSSKGFPGGLGGTPERVPLGFLLMAHGSIKRWEGKQKCFFFPLREYNPSIGLPLYPYMGSARVFGYPLLESVVAGARDARVESSAQNYELP